MNDSELHELFTPRRPDRDAFAAGVAERLRSRRSLANGSLHQRSAAPVRPARAASVLPLDLAAQVGLGGGLGGKLGASFGNAVGGAAGKSLWVWLSLPVLLLAGTFAAFVGGIVTLRRPTEEIAPPEAPTPTNPHPVLRGPAAQMLMIVSPVAALLLLAFGTDTLVDAILLSTLVSMLGLTVALRRGTRILAGDRRSVAAVCMHVLHGVWFGGGFVVTTSFFVEQEALYKGVAGLVMVVTMVLLTAFAARRSWWIAAFAVATLFLLNDEPLGPVRETPAELVAAAEARPLEPKDLTSWQRLDHAVEALRACGVGPVDDTLRARVLGALAFDDPHPRLLTAVAEVARPTEAEWRPFVEGKAAQRDLDGLLVPRRRMFIAAYDLWEMPALLATRNLGAEQLERLVEAVHDAWPAPDGERALADAYVLARWLELLGRPDELVRHRDAVHASLRNRQCGPDVYGKGGFTDFPRAGHGADEETTHHALALMQRFGAPDGVDLDLLHGYLQRNVRKAWSVQALWPKEIAVRADLLWFEHEHGTRPRTWQRFLFEERLLVGLSLLSLLCLIATFQAPAVRPVAGVAP